jgi:hypothetical protein
MIDLKEAEMAKDQFIWIGESTFTRSFGTRAPSFLEKGKSYEAAEIPAEVLAEWIKTGHAKMSAAKPAKEEANG